MTCDLVSQMLYSSKKHCVKGKCDVGLGISCIFSMDDAAEGDAEIYGLFHDHVPRKATIVVTEPLHARHKAILQVLQVTMLS